MFDCERKGAKVVFGDGFGILADVGNESGLVGTARDVANAKGIGRALLVSIEPSFGIPLIIVSRLLILAFTYLALSLSPFAHLGCRHARKAICLLFAGRL